MALRGAWHFNEASGNAIDYGGLSVPIVPAGGATRVADRAGIGRALSGGGQTGTGTTFIAAGSTSWSIAARFQYAGGSGDRGLVTLWDAGSDRGGLYLFNNKLSLWIDTTAGFNFINTNLALTAGQWYEAAAVWNGSTIRLWIDGQLQGESAANAGSVINNIVQIVVTDNTSIAPIGALRVYNHALNEEDVHVALAVEPGWVTNTAVHRFPGALHSSGRYLLDTVGNPYFAVLDSAWDLLHTAPQAQRLGYLCNREAQGFNMAYVGVVRSDVNGSTPIGRTPAGNVPFAGASPSAWNLASPNEAFWLEVDDALTKAEAQGITLWLQVFTTWDDPCCACYTNATDAQVRAFGTWLGNRYKTRPNLVWLFGGDWSSGLNARQPAVARADALILGIRDSGDTHHFAVHMTEESDGHVVDSGTGIGWTISSTMAAQASLRPTYAYRPTYYRNRVAYASTAAKPVFLFEANYEGNPRGSYATDAHVVRRQALWNLTSGGMGHGYGQGRVYQFTESSGDAWVRYLTTTATDQLRALNVRWKSLTGWQNLVPDTGNTLVTSGRGTERTTYVNEHVMDNDYAPAVIAPDKSLAVVYIPSGRAMTLDMTKVGASPTITRVDPTGELADSALTSTISSGSFPPHGDGTSDYLVVITAAASGGTVTKTGLATATGTASSAVTTVRTKAATGLGAGNASSTKTTTRTKASTATAFGTASSVVTRISARASTGYALATGTASAVVTTIRTLVGTALGTGGASSSVVKTEIGHLFAPPGRVVRRGGTHPLFGRLAQTQGISLLKTNGLYRQVENPSAEEVDAAEITYLGGHIYHVSDSEAEALADAGYGAWLTLSEEQS